MLEMKFAFMRKKTVFDPDLDYQSKRDVLEQAEGKQDQPSENGAAESGKKKKMGQR